MIKNKKPFIIICRNRKSLLENALIFAQKKSEFIYPVVADMDSQYPPLRKYLLSIEDKIKVIRFENIGPRNLWKNSKFMEITMNTDFYLSDGDIDYSRTNANVFDEMIRISLKYPGFRKIGSAIRIDDLTEDSFKNNAIKANENPNWFEQREIEKDIFMAPVDTVFAYYPKYTKNLYFWPALRLSGDFQVRHSPWYETENNRSDEETFYAETAKWWGVKGKTAGEILNLNTMQSNLDYKIIRFSKLIKLSLKISPKFGSILLSKIILLSNRNSYVK